MKNSWKKPQFTSNKSSCESLNFNWIFRFFIRLDWPRVAASDRKSDGCIFGRNSDPIAKVKTKFFEKLIRFNSIKQHVNLIELKWIKLNSIFCFFVESDRIHFNFLSDRKIKLASDPIRWPPYTDRLESRTGLESKKVDSKLDSRNLTRLAKKCIILLIKFCNK